MSRLASSIFGLIAIFFISHNAFSEIRPLDELEMRSIEGKISIADFLLDQNEYLDGQINSQELIEKLDEILNVVGVQLANLKIVGEHFDGTSQIYLHDRNGQIIAIAQLPSRVDSIEFEVRIGTEAIGTIAFHDFQQQTVAHIYPH